MCPLRQLFAGTLQLKYTKKNSQFPDVLKTQCMNKKDQENTVFWRQW